MIKGAAHNARGKTGARCAPRPRYPRVLKKKRERLTTFQLWSETQMLLTTGR